MSEHDIAFELGYDVYRYSAEYLLKTNENKDVVEGYNAAKHQQLTRRVVAHQEIAFVGTN